MKQRKEKKTDKIAKARETKTRDLSHIMHIKKEDGKILTQDEEISNRWMEYFLKLLNLGLAFGCLARVGQFSRANWPKKSLTTAKCQSIPNKY